MKKKQLMSLFTLCVFLCALFMHLTGKVRTLVGCEDILTGFDQVFRLELGFGWS